MKNPAEKQSEARERNEARANRTPQQQLARLDAKLGIGIGASKERNRLLAQVTAKTKK